LRLRQNICNARAFVTEVKSVRCEPRQIYISAGAAAKLPHAAARAFRGRAVRSSNPACRDQADHRRAIACPVSFASANHRSCATRARAIGKRRG